MPNEAPSRIPVEWRDPAQVMPHLAVQIVGWLTRLRALEHDLAVVQGGLDPNGTPMPPEAIVEWLTSIMAKLALVDEEIANRALTFQLIGEELQKGGSS